MPPWSDPALYVLCVQFAVPGSTMGAANDDDKEGDGGVTKLYGDWQTREWSMPAAQNGCVPKTERGNVNVPPYATNLPEGASAMYTFFQSPQRS